MLKLVKSQQFTQPGPPGQFEIGQMEPLALVGSSLKQSLSRWVRQNMQLELRCILKAPE